MAETKKKPGRPPGSKNKNTSGSKSGSKSGSSSGTRSKAKEKVEQIQAKKKADRRVMDEIWAIIAIAIGVFHSMNFSSYDCPINKIDCIVPGI